MWIISQKGKWCPGHLSRRKHYADCGGQWRCVHRPGCRLWSIIAPPPLTTSVSVLHRGAMSDPNKNLSGTLPCFATLISPLNLGLWQVRMLLVSLATEMRMTFKPLLPTWVIKKHFARTLEYTDCKIFLWKRIFLMNMYTNIPAMSCDHFGIIWIVPEYLFHNFQKTC